VPVICDLLRGDYSSRAFYCTFVSTVSSCVSRAPFWLLSNCWAMVPGIVFCVWNILLSGLCILLCTYLHIRLRFWRSWETLSVCSVSIESLDRRLVYWMLVSLPKIISISFTGRLYAKHRFHVITAFFPAFMTVRPILAASTQVI